MAEAVAINVGGLVGARRHGTTEPDKSRTGGHKNPEHRVDSHVVPPRPPPALFERAIGTNAPDRMSQGVGSIVAGPMRDEKFLPAILARCGDDDKCQYIFVVNLSRAYLFATPAYTSRNFYFRFTRTGVVFTRTSLCFAFHQQILREGEQEASGTVCASRAASKMHRQNPKE
jgi:hypothetical protein